MQIVTVPLPQLGNRCHLLHDGSHGIVVDPPRDHTVVERGGRGGRRRDPGRRRHPRPQRLRLGRPAARAAGTAPTTSSPPPSGSRSRTWASAAVTSSRSAGSPLEVLHAPGHTEHHQAFLVGDGTGPAALLSGGSLLHGTVGRTDLVAPDRTADLARAQWSTARRLAELPRRTRAAARPTASAASAPAASPAHDDGGTVGDEHLVNPALTLDLDTFVSDLVAGYGPVPSYYRHMAGLNRAGAGDSPGRPAVRVTVEGVTDAVLAGHWVIDVRQRPEFADGHVAGSLNVEHGHQFATYVGWLVPWQDDIVLLADDPTRLDAAVTDLAGIGIEGVGTHVLAAATLLPGQPPPGRLGGAARGRPRDRCCSTSAATTSSTPAASRAPSTCPLHELEDGSASCPPARSGSTAAPASGPASPPASCSALATPSSTSTTTSSVRPSCSCPSAAPSPPRPSPPPRSRPSRTSSG